MFYGLVKFLGIGTIDILSKRCMLLLVSVLFCQDIYGLEVVDITEDNFNGRGFGKRSYGYFGDEPYEIVSSSDFQEKFAQGNSEIHFFPMEKTNFWAKINLLNPLSIEKTIYIRTREPRHGANLQIYSNVESKLVELFDGFSAIELKLPAKKITKLLIRQPWGGQSQLWTYWNDKEILAQESWESARNWAVVTSIFAMSLVFNGMLFFAYRSRMYLYYMAYLIAFCVYTTYVWPILPINYPILNTTGTFAQMGTILFTIDFLKTRGRYPRIHTFFLFSLWSYMGFLIINFFDSFLAARLILNLASVMGLFCFFSAIYVYLKTKAVHIVIYIVAFGTLLVGGVLQVAIWNGFFPSLANVHRLMFYSAAAENILMLMAMGYKIYGDQIEIEKLNKELIEKDKARTTFFNNTSHELRTPLNGIIGFLDLFQKGKYGVLSDKAKQQHKKIRYLAETLKLQVNTILDLAKSKTGSLKLINSHIPLNEILEEANLISESMQAKDMDLQFEIRVSWGQDEKPVFINDREKLMIIIRNLLGNAFKFRDKNRINHVKLEIKIDGKNLNLTVSDTGIGIPQKSFDHIFMEFKQVEESARRTFEGTGLGLAMVKNIVDLMGGTISLDSIVGQGTKFTVEIPEQKDVHVTIQRTIPVENTLPLENINISKKEINVQKSYKILVVDDNQINCEVISDILENNGYPVEICLDGKKAIDLMNHSKPDLVLLDLMMPGFSGEDVLIAMKKSRSLKNIPVILLTARASQEDRLFGLDLGADDYMAKPILSEEIILRVRNMLSRIELASEASKRMLIETTLAEAQEMHSSGDMQRLNIPNIDIECVWQQAELTGGDWINVTHHPATNRLYVLLGDVTGHGMKSALITVSVAGAINGTLSSIEKKGSSISIKESIHELALTANNDLVAASSKMDKNMTMVFACLDLIEGTFYYGNAGHNEVLLKNQSEVSALLIGSDMLGYGKQFELGYREVKLKPCDQLFFYTDGIIGNSGPNGNKINRKKLQAMLATCDEPMKLKQDIIKECGEVWQDVPPKDDYTFLILKWLGPAETLKKRAIV